jgi:hypothetical protein
MSEGSGADAQFVAEIARGANQSADVYLSPGTSKVEKVVRQQLPTVQIIDDNTFYNALRNHGDSIRGIAGPGSELVAALLDLQARGYPVPPVTLFPPGGDHEFHNIAYAVSVGLTGSLVAPEEFHQDIEQGLKMRGLTKRVSLYPPGACTDGLHPPERAWEKPIDAKPLGTVVQQLLS